MIVSRRPLRSRLAPNQLLQRGHTTAFCPTGIPNCLRKTKPENCYVDTEAVSKTANAPYGPAKLGRLSR